MICKAGFEEAAPSLSLFLNRNKQYWHRDASRSPRPPDADQPNSATECAQWPRRPAHPPKDDRRRPSFQAIALQPLSDKHSAHTATKMPLECGITGVFIGVDRSRELDRQKVETLAQEKRGSAKDCGT